MESSTFNRTTTPERPPRLATLAHFIVRHRRAVIVAWAVLTVFGAFSASQVSKRWFESFSIPGYSSYETNQRTLKTFGTGEQSPLVAVFHSDGDVTKQTGIQRAVKAAAKVNPGSRASSYFSTGSPPTSRRTATPPSRRSTRRGRRPSARRSTSTRCARR